MVFRMGLKTIREYRRRKIQKALRARVDNCDVSIFCNNCVGGVIAHDLGLRFNSPTVNLFMSPQDFVKLALEPDYYLGLKKITPIDSGVEYPVGILDDITLHFVHYGSFEAARNAWLRRAERTSLDKSCWILVDRDGLDYSTARTFDEEVSYPHTILTGRACFKEIKSVVYREEWSSPVENTLDLCAFESCTSGTRLVDRFDYVDLVNEAARGDIGILG